MVEGVAKKLQFWFMPCKENDYRPHFLKSKFLVWCVFVLFLFKVILASFIWYFPKSSFFAEVNRIALLNLTNQERQNINLNFLREDQQLDEAAYLKAQDMLENDYFAHTSPSGISPWYWLDKVGYDYQYAGENLAIDFLDSEELYSAWINSPSHKANIVNPNYQDIGIAVVTGEFQGRETTVVVQFFGTKRTLAATPIAENQKALKSQNQSPVSTSTPTSTSVSIQLKNSPTVNIVPKTTSGKNLYNYYIEKGEKFPSFKERAKLFEKYGLGPASTYRGTAEQNIALLNKLLENESLERSQQQQTKISEEATPTPEKNEVLVPSSKGSNLPSQETNISSKTNITPQEPIFPAGKIKGAEIERNSFQFKFFNFMSQNYDKITKGIFLAVLGVILISLLLNIFIRVDIQSKDLILQGLIYCFILLALFFLDKELLLELIPHNLGIL